MFNSLQQTIKPSRMTGTGNKNKTGEKHYATVLIHSALDLEYDT